jgi:hypothetical protein
MNMPLPLLQDPPRTGDPRLPNLFLVGAMKSGTTSLAWLLGQHPGIYLSRWKEPMFFNLASDEFDPLARLSSISSWEDYLGLFEEGAGRPYRLDASTWYLPSSVAAAAIARHAPEARILVQLRDPARRAYSAYHHLAREQGGRIESFETCLEQEEEHIRRRSTPMRRLVSAGLYAEQLKRFYDYFPSERIWVGTFEDFVSDQARTLDDIFRFLGLPPGPSLPAVQINQSGIPRSTFLFRLLQKSRSWRRGIGRMLPKKVKMSLGWSLNRMLLRKDLPDPQTWERLRSRFAHDIGELEKLTGRHFPQWKNSGGGVETTAKDRHV